MKEIEDFLGVSNWWKLAVPRMEHNLTNSQRILQRLAQETAESSIDSSVSSLFLELWHYLNSFIKNVSISGIPGI